MDFAFHIEKRGDKHAVIDESGNIQSQHVSRDEAVDRIKALGIEREAQLQITRKQLANDPETQQRRRDKAAYRLVDRDPMLRALKFALPKAAVKNTDGTILRRAEIEVTTERSYQRALDWLDGRVPTATFSAPADPDDPILLGARVSISPMAMAANDPILHAELNKTPEQRKTSHASEVLGKKGAGTINSVRTEWDSLNDVPVHKRASLIGTKLDISADSVRRILRALGLR